MGALSAIAIPNLTIAHGRRARGATRRAGIFFGCATLLTISGTQIDLRNCVSRKSLQQVRGVTANPRRGSARMLGNLPCHPLGWGQGPRFWRVSAALRAAPPNVTVTRYTMKTT